MEKKKILVIYHKADNDGVCSAAIVKAFYDGRDEAEYEFDFEGVDYSDLSRWWTEWKELGEGKPDTVQLTKMYSILSYDEVFMVDVSFNEIEAMSWMYSALADKFVWCDHHAPIIEASEHHAFGYSKGLRLTNQSAILNTWKYMATDGGKESVMRIEPSKWLRMLSDYDSWAWANMEEYKEGKKEKELFDFNTGVTRKSGLSVDWFVDWIRPWFSLNTRLSHTKIAMGCLEYGEIARGLDVERVSKAIKEHGDTAWTVVGGRKACVILTTDRINSKSFSGFIGTDIVNGAIIRYDAINKVWQISLYNVNDEDDFHCGEYLKERYNGGGHKGAAGCTISEEKLISMLKTKKI